MDASIFMSVPSSLYSGQRFVALRLNNILIFSMILMYLKTTLIEVYLKKGCHPYTTD